MGFFSSEDAYEKEIKLINNKIANADYQGALSDLNQLTNEIESHLKSLVGNDERYDGYYFWLRLGYKIGRNTKYYSATFFGNVAKVYVLRGDANKFLSDETKSLENALKDYRLSIIFFNYFHALSAIENSQLQPNSADFFCTVRGLCRTNLFSCFRDTPEKDTLRLTKLEVLNRDSIKTMAALFVKHADIGYKLEYYAKVLDVCEVAIELDPQNSLSHNLRGVAKSALKRYEEAVISYERAIYLNARDAIIYRNRANAKRALGYYQEAIKDCTAAITYRREARDYNLRGVLKHESGDYEGAVQDYNEAISLSTKYSPYYSNRADSKSFLGDYLGAIEDYEFASIIAPKDDPEKKSYLKYKISKQFHYYNQTSIAKSNLLSQLDIDLEIQAGNSALHLAVRSGDKTLVEFFIQNFPKELRAIDANGQSPLVLAKAQRRSDLIEYLLQQSLLRCVIEGDLYFLKTLINESKSLFLLQDVKDVSGNNLMLLALQHNHIELFKYFCSRAMDENMRIEFLRSVDVNNNNLLHIAARSRNTKFVEFLLNSGMFGLTEKNKDEHAALHIALMHPIRIANVNLLLAHHYLATDINIRRKISLKSLFGNENFFSDNEVLELNAIEMVVVIGNVEVLKLFLECKEVKIKSKMLWLAVEYNQIPILRYLLANNQFLTTSMLEGHSDYEGKHLLSYAAVLDRFEIIRLLIQTFKFQAHQLPTEFSDADKAYPTWSALQWAVYKGKVDAVKELLSFCRDPATCINQKSSDNSHLDSNLTADDIVKNRLEKSQNSHERKALTALKNILSNAKQISYVQALPRGKLLPINLVFQGGGPKGIAHIGALDQLQHYLNENNADLSYIQRVAGTSAGAIIATLLAVGYTPSELINLLSEKNLLDFLDLKNVPLYQQTYDLNWTDILTIYVQCFLEGTLHPTQCFMNTALSSLSNAAKKLYSQAGLCTGDEFLNWIEVRIYEKTGVKHLTLGELAHKNKSEGGAYKHLFIVGVAVSENGTSGRIFSSEDSSMKDYIISDLVRISMSIPAVFQPHHVYIKVRNNGESIRTLLNEDRYYVDGGIFMNYPLEIFDYENYQGGSSNYPLYNAATLGFSLVGEQVIHDDSLRQRLFGKDKNVVNLLINLLQAYFANENVRRSFQPAEQFKERTILVNDLCASTLDFGMSDDLKEKLIESGKNAVKSFFKSTDPAPGFDDHAEFNQPIYPRQYKVQNNAGFDFASTALADTPQLAQSSAGSKLNPVITPLKQILQVPGLIFGWMSSSRLQQPKPPVTTFSGNAIHRSDVVFANTLSQQTATDLHHAVAIEVALKFNLPLQQTLAVLKRNGFAAHCSKSIDNCQINLTEAAVNELENLIYKKRQTELMLAKVNPTLPTIIDSTLILTTFSLYVFRHRNDQGELSLSNSHNKEQKLLGERAVKIMRGNLQSEIKILQAQFEHIVDSDKTNADIQAHRFLLADLIDMVASFKVGQTTVGDLNDVIYTKRYIESSLELYQPEQILRHIN